ncbi:MAG: hypothetical protein ABIP93_17170 [Gemmatimonadaceae bacterium]
MSASTLPPTPDLGPLTADYDVVGELGSKSSARILIATRKSTSGNRRDDDGRVLIEIVRQPEGDESHALQHLASDVKTLSGLRHRRLAPTLEGRWLAGDTAFAIVRERIDDPTLADRLAQTGAFTNTRTAAILREVHGLMEWAREQQIVHRHVTPDRIFLEPVSDKVRIAFAAGPLPRIRTREPQMVDALAIVRLAVSMLTGQRDAGGRSLAELRPDLPERLLEETAALLKDPSSGIDVASYLVLIGMADPVAAGETERDRIRAEVLEEQRVEREKLANERAEFERVKETERRALAAEAEELRRVFAEEQATLQNHVAEAQQSLDAERVRMQRILAEERAALALKHEKLEQEATARQTALERAAAADRESLEELRTKIRLAGEREIERKRAMALEDMSDAEIRLETGELATPAFVRPYIASLDKITYRSGDPLAAETVRRAPTLPESTRLEEVVDDITAPRRKAMAWRRWLIPSGIAAAAVIAAAATIVVVGQRTSSAAAVHRAVRTTTVSVTSARPAPTTVTPSIATPLRHDTAHVATSPAELAAAQQWLDSIRVANPIDMEWALLQSAASERRAARAREPGRRIAAIIGDSSARAARAARDTGARGESGEAHAAPDTTRQESAVAPEPAP